MVIVHVSTGMESLCKITVNINRAHLLFSSRDHSYTSPKNLPTSPYIFSKIWPWCKMQPDILTIKYLVT